MTDGNKSYKIIDTSVIIDGPDDIFDSFKPKKNKENVLVIPMKVFGELERLKKSRDVEAGRNAQHFLNRLEDLEQKVGNLSEGVNLGHGRTIVNDRYLGKNITPLPDDCRDISESATDERIIQLGYHLQQKKEDVEIISSDVSLRIIAHNIGLDANVWNDKRILTSLRNLYKGWRYMKELPLELQEELSRTMKIDRKSMKKFITDPKPNEYFIPKPSAKKSATPRELDFQTIRFDANRDCFVPLLYYQEMRSSGEHSYKSREKGKHEHGVHESPVVKARNIRQACLMDALNNPEISLVISLGPPGTGKTFTAIEAGYRQVIDDNVTTISEKLKNLGFTASPPHYETLVITRPARGEEDENPGWLPGELDVKMGPFLKPIKQNYIIARKGQGVEKQTIEREWQAQLTKSIEIVSLYHVDGLSYVDAYFFVDEAQNISQNLAEILVTRIGKNAKIVLDGNPNRIANSHVNKYNNGLMLLNQAHIDDPSAATIAFEYDDVVRSERAKDSIKYIEQLRAGKKR
jgi:PhoH-like ATPase